MTRTCLQKQAIFMSLSILVLSRVEVAVPHDRQTYRQNDCQKNRTPPLFQDKPPLFITSFQANLHGV